MLIEFRTEPGHYMLPGLELPALDLEVVPQQGDTIDVVGADDDRPNRARYTVLKVEHRFDRDNAVGARWTIAVVVR